MTELLSTRRYRFVGGTYDQPDKFDYDCRLVEWGPRRVELSTLTLPPRRITVESRYIGKAIGPTETATTTRTCTYVIDDGPPPPEGALRGQPEFRGMATWDEDTNGNVTLTAFDYPG
jgi:hypothetical protein